MPDTHQLKTDPEPFQLVWDGIKLYELRFNDRDYKVGDRLVLNETKHSGAEMKAGRSLKYTSRWILCEVKHILTGYGLQEGWIIMSIKVIAKP